MTKNAKDIMVGILGACGVIVGVEAVIGGIALAVMNHKSKKAMKDLEESLNAWKN